MDIKMTNTLSQEDAVQFIEGMYTMAILDKEGRYIYVNPGWCNNSKMAKARIGLQGPTPIDPQTILGRYVWDVVPETKARYTLETGKPLIGEHIRNSDTFTTYIPRFDEEGRPNGCYLYTILGNIEEAMMFNKRLTDISDEREFLRHELAQERDARYGVDTIVGHSEVISNLREQIRMAARVSSAVFINGETGTGKELIAKAIHTESPRAEENFVRVNCAAIPESSLESELFGYAVGAGPGKKSKRGFLDRANNGTLLLDEIEFLPQTMQPRLLSILQDREFTPIGALEPVSADFKVISSTKEDLRDLVDSGKFREDLYFQLNVISITAPPLRDHKEDLPELVDDIVGRLNQQLGMMVQGLDSRVMQLFEDYDWPGNIRELQNALERAMSMTNSAVLIPSDFEGLEVRMRRTKGIGMDFSTKLTPGKKKQTDLREGKAIAEKNMLYDALTKYKGNKSMAAKALGISRSNLYRKMEKYGIK